MTAQRSDGGIGADAVGVGARDDRGRGRAGGADQLAPPGPGDKPGADARPFDVREYEAAAARVSEAAREVTRTLDTIERPAAGSAASKDGTALAQAVTTLEGAIGRTIDRALYRLLLLVGAIVVGWGVVWLVVRRVGRAR